MALTNVRLILFNFFTQVRIIIKNYVTQIAVVAVPGGGVCPGGWLSARGGVGLPGGCLPAGPPSVDTMADTGKNITLPQLCCGR